MVDRITNEYCFGKKVYRLESVDSTNTFARNLSEEDAPHGTLVIAEEQTAGRGRLGRQWKSDPGENLLFTLLLRPASAVEKLTLLPFAAAVGIADGIELATGVALETKWPNDLLCGNKKVCGILIEGSMEPGAGATVAVGAGINVNQMSFPGEIEHTAASLFQITGRRWPKSELLQAILPCLEDRFLELCNAEAPTILASWKKRSSMMGRDVLVTEQLVEYEATAVDLDTQGALIIRHPDGTVHSVFSGDVSIRHVE
jgi:BirA family transcriptional regulator, biotin operon repressor / biotin---[acetyl-CoA-carboxylase] ligase